MKSVPVSLFSSTSSSISISETQLESEKPMDCSPIASHEDDSSREDVYIEHKKLKLRIQDIQSKTFRFETLSLLDKNFFGSYARHLKKIYNDKLRPKEDEMLNDCCTLRKKIEKRKQIVNSQLVDTITEKRIFKDVFLLFKKNLEHMQSYPWTEKKDHYLNNCHFLNAAHSGDICRNVLFGDSAEKNTKATALYSMTTVFLVEELRRLVCELMLYSFFSKNFSEELIAEQLYFLHTKNIIFPKRESHLEGFPFMSAYCNHLFFRLKYHYFENNTNEFSGEDVGFYLTESTDDVKNMESKLFNYIEELSASESENNLTEYAQFKKIVDLLFVHPLAHRCLSFKIVKYRFHLFSKLENMIPEKRAAFTKAYWVQSHS